MHQLHVKVLLMCNHNIIDVLTKYVIVLQPSLFSPAALTCIHSKPFNTITSFLILSDFVEGGVKMNCNDENFLLMSPILPFVFPFLVPFITIIGLPHNRQKWPVSI